MLMCPNCGKKVSNTPALRGRIQKYSVTSTICLACGKKFEVTKEDLDVLRNRTIYGKSQHKKPTLSVKEIEYRREYGLCLTCGEPVYKNNRYCKTCLDQHIHYMNRNNKHTYTVQDLMVCPRCAIVPTIITIRNSKDIIDPTHYRYYCQCPQCKIILATNVRYSTTESAAIIAWNKKVCRINNGIDDYDKILLSQQEIEKSNKGDI